MEKDYRDLLDRAYSQLPEQVTSYERWTVPRPDVRTVGRRTVIMNFKEIADELRRDPEHLLEVYTNRYVVCPVCKRPDTRIVRDRRLWFLQCEACGARSSIGAK